MLGLFVKCRADSMILVQLLLFFLTITAGSELCAAAILYGYGISAAVFISS